MKTGLLRGRDHTRLGAVAALAEGRAAVALSRGGAAKTYDHADPNEDACAFALGDRGWLVAVADGHWGCGGAERVLERIFERHAPRWTSPMAIALAERWVAEAPEVVLDLNRALVAAESGGGSVGRTTLSLCLARPDDGWWAGLCVGDSHLFRVDADGVREPWAAPASDVRFLGDPRLDRARAEAGLRAGVERGAMRGAIVLATDGLSETGIGVADAAAAVAASVVAVRRDSTELRPLATARGLALRALEAQRRQRSGDNVATACLWLEG